jgi:hypothetical protein
MLRAILAVDASLPQIAQGTKPEVSRIRLKPGAFRPVMGQA